MKTRERNLFFAIAAYAIDNGCGVSLERKNNTHNSEALNGILANTRSMDRGLILRVQPPEESEVEDDNG